MKDSGFVWIIIGLLVLGALAAANSEPAMNDSVPAPQFKVGDSWTYKYHFRVENITYTVAEVGNKRVIMKRSDFNFDHQVIFTSEGNMVRTTIKESIFDRYEPELPLLKFPLYPGKSWTEDIKVSAIYPPYIDGPARVMMVASKWEEISVPAGNFKAIKIIGQYEAMFNSTGMICWYAPKAKRFVSCVFTRRPDENFELLEFKAGK